MELRKYPVSAIHPDSGNIHRAIVIMDYFGKEKHAIHFGGINSPYYSASKIEWELLPTA